MRSRVWRKVREPCFLCWQELFEGADANNDGIVTFDEFIVMMSNSDIFDELTSEE